ncbi:MAG: hypothetical protein ACOCXJ_07380, partial [Planctomycetota bacterium]
FIGALDALHACAGVCGDADTAGWSTELATHMRADYAARYSDDDGLIRDTWSSASGIGASISEHANLAAIRFGCVGDAQAQRIIDRIFAHPDVVECQPFFMVVVLEALRRQGRCDLALQLIRDRWGRMLDDGATSTYEEWTCNGSFRDGPWAGFLRSQSHAWSACAAAFLIRQLPGIEILEPGCERLRIRPYTGLDYVSTAPTPRGVLIVRVQDGAVAIESPPEISIERS